MTVVCTKCGRELPETEFYVCRRRKTGRRSACKDCDREYQRRVRKDSRADPDGRTAKDRAAKAAPKPKKKEHVVDKTCRGCIYMTGGKSEAKTCEYKARTGRSRLYLNVPPEIWKAGPALDHPAVIHAGSGCPVKKTKREEKET